MTVKTVAVLTFPPGVITLMIPVVAPLGTFTLSLVAVSYVMVPCTPLNVTLVTPVRFAPLMTTVVPTGPEAGAKLVMEGAASTVRVKAWVASGATPLCAMSVIGKVPVTVGVPVSWLPLILPEIARVRSLGRVSGWGWSLGYIGGLTALGLCLMYVTWAQAQGQIAAQFVPVTMLMTAGLFALSSLPTFLLLRERALPRPAQAVGFGDAWRAVRQSLHLLRQLADLRRFLVCMLFYQAGIQTVIILTAIYAHQAMGFTLRQTLILVIVVNITAAVGAFLFGYLQDRIGHVRAIALTLVGWITTILLAWAAREPTLFWVAANLAGLCLGATQSASRALMGVLAPPSRLAEFYGFWGLVVKLASIAGPLTYGATTWLTGGDHRRALLLTGSYFVIGLFLLPGVRVARGRRAALRIDRLDRIPLSNPTRNNAS